MKVVAVIHDRIEIDRILQHLIKIGRGPPGYEGCKDAVIQRSTWMYGSWESLAMTFLLLYK